MPSAEDKGTELDRRQDLSEIYFLPCLEGEISQMFKLAVRSREGPREWQAEEGRDYATLFF